MNLRRPPRAAQALLRHLGGRYSESLEGDLLEEFAAGRTSFWYCRQVGCALYERACFVARQHVAAFLAAALFFLVTLWFIAPVTYRVTGWARSLESLDILVLLGWLAGVPFVLGAVAGATQRRRRIGAILLGAAFAWLTPVTLPFTSAACDLCTRSEYAAAPDAVLFLAPLVSALLAGLGAWVVAGFHGAASQERSS